MLTEQFIVLIPECVLGGLASYSIQQSCQPRFEHTSVCIPKGNEYFADHNPGGGSQEAWEICFPLLLFFCIYRPLSIFCRDWIVAL